MNVYNNYNTMKSTTTINDLPDEVLLHILSKLSPLDLQYTVAQVCIKWRLFAFSPCLRYHFVISKKKNSSFKKNFERVWCSVIAASPMTHTVEYREMTPHCIISAVAENCLCLKTLKVPHANLTKLDIDKLVEGCPYLREVELNSFPLDKCSAVKTLSQLKSFKTNVQLDPTYENYSVSSAFIRDLVSQCSTLEHLIIPNIRLEEKDLKFVMNHMKERLKSLSIIIGQDTRTTFSTTVNQCINLEKLYVKAQSEKFLSINFVKNLTFLENITDLEFFNCKIEFTPNHANQIINSTDRYCSLKYLSLKQCLVSDTSFLCFAKFFYKIKIFHLDQVKNVSDRGLVKFLKACDSLTRVSILNTDGISDCSVEALLSKSSIKFLEISMCENVSPEFGNKFQKNTSEAQFIFRQSIVLDLSDIFVEPQ